MPDRWQAVIVLLLISVMLLDAAVILLGAAVLRMLRETPDA